MDDLSMATLINGLLDKDTRYNPQSTIRVSNAVVGVIKDYLQSKTDYELKVTNNVLVQYALIKLLDPQAQQLVIKQLRHKKANKTLLTLLNLDLDPGKSPSVLNKEKLENVEDRLIATSSVIEGLSNALALILLKEFRVTGPDLYRYLRRDDVKGIIDSLHQAGINESERQKHLHV